MILTMRVGSRNGMGSGRALHIVQATADIRTPMARSSRETASYAGPGCGLDRMEAENICIGTASSYQYEARADRTRDRGRCRVARCAPDAHKEGHIMNRRHRSHRKRTRPADGICPPAEAVNKRPASSRWNSLKKIRCRVRNMLPRQRPVSNWGSEIPVTF